MSEALEITERARGHLYTYHQLTGSADWPALDLLAGDLGVIAAAGAHGEIASLAETLVLLLLIVFAAVNADLLILRRESGEAEHFRVPLAVPWCGRASSLFLLTRIDGAVWLRGSVLVGAGILLAAVNAVRTHSVIRPHPSNKQACGPGHPERMPSCSTRRATELSPPRSMSFRSRIAGIGCLSARGSAG